MVPIGMPDYVVPLAKIGTYLDSANQVCGLLFEDTSGKKYLLPMPGKVLAGVSQDIQKATASVVGLMEWQSKLPEK